MQKSLFVACMAVAMLVPSTFVAAQSANDKAMAQMIGSRLKESGQLRDYRIGVKYEDGVTWLSGTVSNQQQLAMAMRLTQGIQGVDHVVNNLSITGPMASAPAGGTLDLGGSLQQASRQSTPTAAARPMMKPPYVASSPPATQRIPMPQQRNNMPRPMQPMPVQQASAQSMGPTQAQYAQAQHAQAQYAQAQYAQAQRASQGMGGGYAMAGGGAPIPTGYVPGGARAASYDNANMPGYAWPSYSAYPNYAALSYPQQYSPSAWPYIGPFYPYPQVPLGWREVSLEWDDGWWFLDFSDCGSNH